MKKGSVARVEMGPKRAVLNCWYTTAGEERLYLNADSPAKTSKNRPFFFQSPEFKFGTGGTGDECEVHAARLDFGSQAEDRAAPSLLNGASEPEQENHARQQQTISRGQPADRQTGRDDLRLAEIARDGGDERRCAREKPSKSECARMYKAWRRRPRG